MKLLTVEEATAGLGQLVERALAGEQIQIRQGSGVVELRPAEKIQPVNSQHLAPREALRQLQADGRLTSQQAEQYLNEVRAERVASENQRPG
jgi:antitoxin (DNA-binding transcriptional repressor) of toxin-antitoxin stability system